MIYRSIGSGVINGAINGVRGGKIKVSQSLIRSITSSTGPTTSSTRPKVKSKSLLRFFTIGAGLGIGGGILYSTNDSFRNTTKHTVQTLERVSVVTIATFRCFKLYKDTLDGEYDSNKDRAMALKRTHKRAAYITLKALETNGGIYIKLGQHITALTYLLPEEWTSTMIPLQDRCPESSMEQIEQLFLSDMGVSINELFSEFDPHPVGVASLAQVHMATLRNTGEKVAVKIQHPTLREFVPLDVKLTQVVFKLMHKVFPEYPLTWLGDELQNSIFVELDFTNEAENAKKTDIVFQNRKSLTALRIPKVIDANPRILIMECVTGSRLDKYEYLQENNINPSEVSSCLSHIFNSMIFEPGVSLHCDPHGGNLAIRAVPKHESKNGHNFEIILYDHGLYRDIPISMKRDYSHFWLSVLEKDVPKMKYYAEKMAGIKGDQKFKIFLSAITGRDPQLAVESGITSRRTRDETLSIQNQLQSTEGALEDLMEILSTMPRMILLILKTNDLTRNLDENLRNPLGPERTFLIMIKYCAVTLYDEAKEGIRKETSRVSLARFRRMFGAWWTYEWRVNSVFWYDIYMIIFNFVSST